MALLGLLLTSASVKQECEKAARHSGHNVLHQKIANIIKILVERIHLDLRSEVDSGRLILWLPVFLALGILLYFGAAHEPSLAAVCLLAGGLGLASFFARRNPVAFAILLLCSCVASGFALATSRTAWVSHYAMSQPPDFPLRLQGFVEKLERRTKSDRIVLRLTSRTVPGLHKVPERVRLTLRKGVAPPVGAHIEQLVRLMPPLQPAMPGAQDFGRGLWFDGIGGIGYGLGSPVIMSGGSAERAPFSVHVAAAIQSVRIALADRIQGSLNGTPAAIAVALVTGDRAAIPPQIEESMRISGLTHILSISGLHMAMVAGTLFALVRGGLALFPSLALGWPIKSVAALVALAGGAFYLALSGNEVPAQRSFIMTGLVLIGVIAGRQALTLRTVAVAFFCVLVLTPEALLEPGTQMSFSATLALVAGYQWLRPYLSYPRPEGWGAQIIWFMLAFMGGLAITSILAGVATAPYGAFHFQRASTYGLLSNLAAMPAVSLLVMPFGLIGVLLIPFGWDSIAWPVMGFGIEVMIAVSEWCANLPGADIPVTWINTANLLLITLALLLLSIPQGLLKLCALPFLCVAVFATTSPEHPDILIAPNTHTIAVRGEDGKLSILNAPRARMFAEQWLNREGDRRALDDPALASSFSCDHLGCVATLKDRGVLAVSHNPVSLEADCLLASIVVTEHMPPGDCPARVITAQNLEQTGTLALYHDAETGWRERASRSMSQSRPWQPYHALPPTTVLPFVESEVDILSAELWVP
ncbi:ComEC/Rec2 family competence protein [Xanthobacter sp. TB0139]|uniref:ComEC/Rec2 family competence protein n=1 Tax=Xanthobacter sp. TB0139 TaxID=3459178 RepID=UPI00403995F5